MVVLPAGGEPVPLPAGGVLDESRGLHALANTADKTSAQVQTTDVIRIAKLPKSVNGVCHWHMACRESAHRRWGAPSRGMCIAATRHRAGCAPMLPKEA